MKSGKLKIAFGDNDKDIFQSIENVFKKVTDLIGVDNKKNNYLISLIFFINSDKDSFFDVRNYIIKRAKKTFSNIPAISIIGQPPADGSNILLEAEFVENKEIGTLISYLQIKDGIYCTKIENSNSIEYYFFGLTISNERDSLTDQVKVAFEILDNALISFGLGMDNIVRQWNYVEDIVGFTPIENGLKQNYQVLNNIRHEYYSKYEFSKGFPAATGIGMSSGGFVLDCIAVMEKADLEITPIKNPIQVSAYDYSNKVLIGSKIEKNFPLLSPKFERAKLLKEGNDKYSLLISGTASIQKEESLAKDNAGVQTEITFENIGKLIEYGSKHIMKSDRQIDRTTYNYLRVYIKNIEDFKKVKSICEKHAAGIVPVYLIADICRDELLVEIEGATTFFMR
jgi:enamine deaminase RidA (YjgF/YER057c/UK114 family)